MSKRLKSSSKKGRGTMFSLPGRRGRTDECFSLILVQLCKWHRLTFSAVLQRCEAVFEFFECDILRLCRQPFYSGYFSLPPFDGSRRLRTRMIRYFTNCLIVSSMQNFLLALVSELMLSQSHIVLYMCCLNFLFNG